MTIQKDTSGPSQLFKYRRAGTDDEGDAIFNIVSVQHPHLHLSLSTCSKNADVLLLKPNDDAEQHQNWIIKGASIVNLCENNDQEIKKGSLSIDMTGASEGLTISVNIKNDETGQKWTVKSNNVVLSRAGYGENPEKNANQTFIPHFVDSGYELGLLPGFPGVQDQCDVNECLSSTKDRYLAKEAMRVCDESMSFLIGSELSLGTLKAVVDSIEENGPGRMPGYCCMDDATNSEFWGYNVSVNDTVVYFYFVVVFHQYLIPQYIRFCDFHRCSLTPKSTTQTIHLWNVRIRDFGIWEFLTKHVKMLVENGSELHA